MDVLPVRLLPRITFAMEKKSWLKNSDGATKNGDGSVDEIYQNKFVFARDPLFRRPRFGVSFLCPGQDEHTMRTLGSKFEITVLRRKAS